jgi:hypothetical protein
VGAPFGRTRAERDSDGRTAGDADLPIPLGLTGYGEAPRCGNHCHSIGVNSPGMVKPCRMIRLR